VAQKKKNSHIVDFSGGAFAFLPDVLKVVPAKTTAGWGFGLGTDQADALKSQRRCPLLWTWDRRTGKCKAPRLQRGPTEESLFFCDPAKVPGQRGGSNFRTKKKNTRMRDITKPILPRRTGPVGIHPARSGNGRCGFKSGQEKTLGFQNSRQVNSQSVASTVEMARTKTRRLAERRGARICSWRNLAPIGQMVFA